MICNDCHGQNQEKERFCIHCGHELLNEKKL